MSVFPNLRSPNQIIPAAAASVNLIPGGAGTFGAYAQMLASAASNLLLTGLSIYSNVGFTLVDWYEVEIAVGAPGSEVAIATIPGHYKNGNGISSMMSLTFPFPLSVASGSRIAARVRNAGGDTTAYTLSLRAVPTSYTGVLYPTSAIVKSLLSGSDSTVTGGASAWTNGTVVQLSASMPNDTVVFMVAAAPAGLGWNAEWELDLCTGGAGAEVSVATLRNFNASMDNPGWHRIIPIKVTSGTRLSARLRTAAGAVGLVVKVGYYDNPGASIPVDLLASASTVIAPAAAAGIGITQGNTYSAWNQVLASAATDYALLDVVPNSLVTDIDVQVGIGAIGSEVVVATIQVGGSNANCAQTGGATLPLGVATIPAGSRVAIRARHGSASTTVGYALTLIPQSGLSTPLLITAKPQVLPDTSVVSGLGVSLVGSGAAWTNGAWTELSTGLTDKTCAFAITVAGVTSPDYEIDLGYGTAGAETVAYTWRLVATNSDPSGRAHHFSDAVVALADGVRIAMRVRSGNGATVQAKLSYYGPLDPDGPIITSARITQMVVLTMAPNAVACPTPSEGENLCQAIDDPVLFASWDPGDGVRRWYGETELDDNDTYYGGWKDARLLAVSEVRRAMAGPSLDYEVGNFSVEFSDEDYAIRVAMGTYFTNREIEVYAVTPDGRHNAVVPKKVATGFIDADPSFDDHDSLMSVRFTCRDRVGQAMGWTQNGRSQLPRRVLSAINLPGCRPTALGKGVPVWYGLLSTNVAASGVFNPPVHAVDASHCGFFDGAYPNAGYGNWFRPPAPLGTVTVSVLAGGSLPQETPHNEGRYYVQVFPVASNGDVGDPFPFCSDALFADISPGNQTIQASWSPASGAARYIAVLGVYYYGVRAQQYLETTDTSVQFTKAPKWMEAGSIWDLITPGARPPEDAAITYYAVRSKNGNVISELAPNPQFASVSVQTGFHCSNGARFRPARIWWQSSGAPQYEVLSKGPGGPITSSDYEWKWIVPSGQYDASAGLHYFDNDFLYQTAIPLGAQEARPAGRVKPFYTRDVVLPDTDTWREFLIAGCALQGVDDWYYDPMTGPITDVEINQGDGTEWLFPKDGSAWFSKFTTKYRDLIGIDGLTRRYTVGYGRGPKADLVASGNSIITLNLRGIETTGSSTGALITDLHDQTLHFLRHFVVASGEGYMSGAWGPMPTMGTEDICVIDEQSFTDLKAKRQSELAGGLITAGGIGANGELIDVAEGLKRFMTSGDFRLGPNRFWQIAAYALNESLTQADMSPALSDEFDAHLRTFKPQPKMAELQNVLPYRYNRNFVQDRWDADNQLYTNQASIDRWHVTQLSEALEFHFLTEPVTANFIIQKHARRRGDVPIYVVIEGSVCLMHEDYDVGKVFPLKHWRGLGRNGWRLQAMWIQSCTFNPETRRVRLECLNQGRAPGACAEMPFPMPTPMCET